MNPETKVIGEVKNGNIIISISEFNKVKYADIRKYYKDENDEMQPTKKGIALNKEQFTEVLDILVQKKEEIENHL